MDIHKPKPVRNWRDFFKEVGIIVLGVSIALAAEQGVEWFHWRAQVAQAREVIAAEMATNLYGAISRVRNIDCAERRLDALSVIVDAAAKTGSLPPVGQIGMPWRQIYPSGAWESVMASQTATHFPSQQLADLSTAYKVVERLENATNQEMEAWNSLYAMVGPGRRLDPASEAKLRDALSQARTGARRITSLSVQLIGAVKRLHLHFSRESRDRLALAEHQPLNLKTDVCVPIGAVPANYGQGYIPNRAAEIVEMGKHLPDFGGEVGVMDLHKPKPIHGWRDFLKEVGIIVLGVSIALAAEQGVERWRLRRQYDEARQAMRDELANNLANIGRRERYAACTKQRIKDIGAILDRAQSGQSFQAPSWIGPSFSYRVRFAAENETGKSTLFTAAEQFGYGSPYAYFHSIDTDQDRERLAWGRLRMLEGQSHLTPEMIQTLRNALADARFEYDRIAYLTLWANAFGKQLGLMDLSHQGQYTTDIFRHHPHCLPMNVPADQAERDAAVVIAPMLNDDRFKAMPVFERQ